MVIKREVADGIVRGLSEFWNCEELQDFTVVAGDTNFGCHRFLLAACSGFFRALFRSGMKETKLNCVTLEEISSETFQLLLETIYTGRGILTNDTVIGIWRAAHQLQVTFMVTECEMFVIKSLSLANCVQYFHYGRMLSSKIVTETVWTFILKHCNYFFKTSYFLYLPFCDVLNLIKCQDLETSTEDEVLKAILKWVEYKPDIFFYIDNTGNCLQVAKERIHSKSSDMKGVEEGRSGKFSQVISKNSTTEWQLKEAATDIRTVLPCDNSMSCEKTEKVEGELTESDNRKQYVFDLLSASRTCLVSQECLVMLLCHPLVIENKEAIAIFSKALLYQLHIDKRSGQWPSGATHRNNSILQNVAVRFTKGSNVLDVFTFSKNKWSKYRIYSKRININIIIRLITIDRSLYSLYVQDGFDEYVERSLNISSLTQTTWSDIDVSLTLSCTIFSVVAVNEFIYILQRNKFWKLNPLSPSPVQLPDLPENHPICHVTVYDQKIIAFYSMSKEGGVEETTVLSFDISNNTWTRLNNIEGPADGMISFKYDHSTYLLQSNGNMWKLVKPQSDIVDFEFVVKLWGSHWPLHGAVTFMDKLYISGTKSETIEDDPQLLKSVAGLFREVIYLESLESDSTKSMFVPFIANRYLIS